MLSHQEINMLKELVAMIFAYVFFQIFMMSSACVYVYMYVPRIRDSVLFSSLTLSQEVWATRGLRDLQAQDAISQTVNTLMTCPGQRSG